MRWKCFLNAHLSPLSVSFAARWLSQDCEFGQLQNRSVLWKEEVWLQEEVKMLRPGPCSSFSAFADFLWNLKKHFFDLSIKLCFIFPSSFPSNLNVKIVKNTRGQAHNTLFFYYTHNWNKSSYFWFPYIALYFYYIAKNHQWTLHRLNVSNAQSCRLKLPKLLLFLIYSQTFLIHFGTAME